MNESLILRNERLEVELAPPGKVYRGSRFDRGGFIKQITLDGTHTFLGRERTKAGLGTGGLGMIHGWIWKNDSLYEAAPVGGSFPILGVGTARKTNVSAFNARDDYEVSENTFSIREIGSTDITFVAEQFFQGSPLARIERSFTLKGCEVAISTTLSNPGSEPLAAEEYNHNFLYFDRFDIDPRYRVSFDFPFDVRMVRGEIVLGTDYFYPAAFDPVLGTLAFVPKGFESSDRCSTTIENQTTRTKIRLKDGFTPNRAYVWISPWCLCPETFKSIELRPGESESFLRTVEVSSL